MSDPLIREMDNFVVLEPGKKEQFLSYDETLSWLCYWLEKLETLPEDLIKKTKEEAAQYLMDTACDLEIQPGFKLQWFAIRLDSPH